MRLSMKCPACEKLIVPEQDGFLLVCPECGEAIKSVVNFTVSEDGDVNMGRPNLFSKLIKSIKGEM